MRVSPVKYWLMSEGMETLKKLGLMESSIVKRAVTSRMRSALRRDRKAVRNALKTARPRAGLLRTGHPRPFNRTLKIGQRRVFSFIPR